jgi:hypothetical protein
MKKLKLAIIAGFVLAGAVFGISQQSAEAALPGQVGDAPRCNVSTGKARNNSFVVSGATASVTFTAEGGANCRVQVSNNSFYAPSIDGKPWSAQILFDRNTKTFGPGKHTLSIKVPTKSTKEKGCFYQLDLTYGQRNVLPVLAYEHGAIKDCGQVAPKPEAACVSLTAKKLDRTQFQLNAKASVKNGAKVTSYTFVTTGNGTTETRTVSTTSLTAAHVYRQTKPGTYTSKVTVNTTAGPKNGAACTTTLTVVPEVPGKITVCEIATKKTVTIDKTPQLSDKYTTDFSKCAATVVTPPTPESPKALPDTGVGAVFAIFTGVTSLSSAAYYVFSRRLI